MTRLAIKSKADVVEILRFSTGTRSKDSPSLSPDATRARVWTSLVGAGPVDTSPSLISEPMSSSEPCLLVSVLAMSCERRGRASGIVR